MGIKGQSLFYLKTTVGLVFNSNDILVLLSMLHLLELLAFLSHLLNPGQSLFALSDLLQLLRA